MKNNNEPYSSNLSFNAGYRLKYICSKIVYDIYSAFFIPQNSYCLTQIT